jgi:hypothetical protein
MYDGYRFPSNPNLEDTLRDKPPEQRIWAGRRLEQAPEPIMAKQFFGSHTFIDAEIGRLLDAIEHSAQNAIVVYTSDHGVFLDSHRLADKGPAMYDEITRVPFLVRWPGHTPTGSVNSNLIPKSTLRARSWNSTAATCRRRSKVAACCRHFSTPAGACANMHSWSGTDMRKIMTDSALINLFAVFVTEDTNFPFT